MASSRVLLFFFCSIFLHLVALTIAQQNNLLSHNCTSNEGNFTTNSTYQANLYQLLSSLSSNTQIDYGFYNASNGRDFNQVNAMALCRGDIKPDSCRSCVSTSILELPKRCPNEKEAFMWSDNCMLRYSHRNFFGDMQFAPWFWMLTDTNVSDADTFNQAVGTLLDSLKNKAASGDSHRKFATGNKNASNSQTIYALVQCTPDLSTQECRDCLTNATALLPTCCNGKQGGRVVGASCNLRYETNQFFEQSIEGPSGAPEPTPPPPSTTPPPPPDTTSRGKKNRAVIIIVAISVVAFMILIISIGIFLIQRNSKKEDKNTEDIISAESLQFDFRTIRVATDDFSDANKLGRGGFGSVYKGMLSSGQQIAVKRLSKNSDQGELEFKNEVVLVARLQHRNLARLLGFCLERKERILVYELVPNASLDHFLFNPINRKNLNWERRYNIVKGIARGLLYLHEDSRLRIIHRDLKASNVLLDSDMNPKISDFGLAKLFEMDQTHSNTDKRPGTRGYMAPEYFMHGRYSVKSDIFSFGVLVLEIVSGQKRRSFGNEDETEDLLTYARRNWNEGAGLNLIDPNMTTGPTSEMMKCIHIGLLCVQEDVADRPSMATVVSMLNSETNTLAEPSKPEFFMKSSVIDEQKIKTVPLSKNEASITELSPR
ncbi:Cysteine rich receptor like kinase [Melia azedarach]|uniref:Cysteine rich receptor like kinase n=1 Tax=Melia azedarach TaxID=155640 RepID=A0ACC1WY48_MELAZ|nr:Cysteine rich receptor like kinase [Melia azedarach]